MKESNVARVKVRPLRIEERSRFEKLMELHHYLGWGLPVGEGLNYVAEVDGRWVALLTFGAAAYALKDREAWVGWTCEQRKRRLKFIAQNRRFLILPEASEKNMASRILGQCAKRLADDWRLVYGHPVLVIETFVDPQRFEGTCYRAAGWVPLGLTAGVQRIKRDYYEMGGSPKQLFVKSLRHDAHELLCADEWPKAWQKHEVRLVASSPLKTRHGRSLYQAFNDVPEFRRTRGLRHKMPAVLACVACAVLAGAKGISEMAEIIEGFDARQLRALRCYKNPRTGRMEAPSESTLRRVLAGVDAEKFDTVVASWVSGREDIKALALDGKALRGCLNEDGRPLFLVSAVAHGTGAFQGQVAVDCKTNEIPAARELLKQLGPLDGVMVTTDAAHTQIATAHQIVIEHGGDYFSPVKGNQPNLLKKAEQLLPKESFFPYGSNRKQRARAH